MTLDIATCGSTYTIIHQPAAALDGEIDFDLNDIDKLSREAPHFCKIAPTVDTYHIEDVHRAGRM